jgi:two-component system response regulator MtrA
MVDDVGTLPTMTGAPQGRVLLVEDDAAVRSAVGLVLRASGFEVLEVDDGRSALEAFDGAGADAVILDVMLPGVDGFEVCGELRGRSHVPILMMTARDDAQDIVRGLELGADDYVTKPFEAAVLLARLRAALRRVGGETDELLEVGDLRVDVAAHRAWRAGVELSLSAIEFRLLVELVAHAGQAMTRNVLLDRVWGYDYLGDSRLVDMAIKRLRDKVEDDPRAPRRVTTLRGVGYRLERD